LDYLSGSTDRFGAVLAAVQVTAVIRRVRQIGKRRGAVDSHDETATRRCSVNDRYSSEWTLQSPLQRVRGSPFKTVRCRQRKSKTDTLTVTESHGRPYQVRLTGSNNGPPLPTTCAFEKTRGRSRLPSSETEFTRT